MDEEMNRFLPVREHGLARVGKIETKHGTIKTPTIFPVHNIGANAGWNTPRYWEIFPEINTAMFNATYILLNNRKVYDKIRLAGGIHRFLNFPGIAFIDSGGFVKARKSLKFNAEIIMKIQEEIGADIASTLDEPFSLRDKDLYEKVYLSVKNAEKAKKKTGMLLYASVHGNDPIVLHNVLKYLSKRKTFDGYAVGSLVPIRSNFRLVVDLILAAKKAVKDKPLHIYGLGGLLTIPLLAYLGVDSVDSTAYIYCGGKRRYFIPGYRDVGMEWLNKLDDLPCACPICCSNTIKVLRNSRNLLALHNLWSLWFEIKQVRFAISEGYIEKYLEKRFSRTPIVAEAFEYAKMKIKNLV